jgi:mono/diheme cytochrome c family protein
MLLAAAIYGASELRRLRTYDVALTDFTVRTDLSMEEAERRTRSLMCMGCHQEAGNVIFEAPGVGKLVAPNLTRLVPTYSDAELERLIRHGVKKDGTGVIAMPSASFAHLADEDVSAIVSWLRSREPLADNGPPATEWGPLGRVALALGQVPYDADRITRVAASANRPKALGRYLYESTCSHCHDLEEPRQVQKQTAPGLKVVAPAYPPEAFRALLRTGKGLGDRELGLMSVTAREDLRHFSDHEIDEIYRFLTDAEAENQARGDE